MPVAWEVRSMLHRLISSTKVQANSSSSVLRTRRKHASGLSLVRALWVTIGLSFASAASLPVTAYADDGPRAAAEVDYQFYVKHNAADKEAAIAALQRAATSNHADAQATLGDLTRIGDGVRKDEREAIEWYVRAIENGATKHKLEMLCAVLDYAVVKYAPTNERVDKTISEITALAESNDLSAQILTARIYDAAFGVPWNDALGGYWYTRAQKTIQENPDRAQGLIRVREDSSATLKVDDLLFQPSCSKGLDAKEQKIRACIEKSESLKMPILGRGNCRD